MEPVSAFALACNVLQVIETAIKAATCCKEIYETGSLAENDRVEEIAKELSLAGSSLTDQLKRVKLSARDIRVKRLAEESQTPANELAIILRKLKFAKGQNSGRALVQTIKTMAKRNPVGKLLLKLEKQDTLLNSVILKEFSYPNEWARQSVRYGRHETQQTATFQKLDRHFQKMILSYANLQQSVSQAQAEVISQTQISEQNITHDMQQVKLSSEILAANANLLKSLHFTEITDRQNMIQQRVASYGATYEWIFSKQQTHAYQRAAGQKLQQDQAEDQHPMFSTKTSSRLVLTPFFFTGSRSQMQMSFEGFSRTICHQLISRAPGLTAVYRMDPDAPMQLRTRLQSSVTASTWILDDLKAMLEYLLRRVASKRSVFLIVDGLDELEDGQEEFGNYLQALDKTIPSLNIYCSGRSEPLLNDLFKNCLSLKLHLVNHDDLYDYSRRKLQNTKAEFLMGRVMARSEGVFFWLCLVVEDLRRAARYEDEAELSERLSQTPDDMFSVFSNMLSRQVSKNRHRSRPFLPLVALSLQDEALGYANNVLTLTIAADANEVTWDEQFLRPDLETISRLNNRCALGVERITAHCAGLVEETSWRRSSDTFSEIYTGRFHHLRSAYRQPLKLIHRSVGDFLDEAYSTDNSLNLAIGEKKNQYLRLLYGTVQTIQIVQSCQPSLSESDSFSSLLFSARKTSGHKLLEVIITIIKRLLELGCDALSCYKPLDRSFSAVYMCFFGASLMQEQSLVLNNRAVFNSILPFGFDLQDQVQLLIAADPFFSDYILNRLEHTKPSQQRPLVVAAFFVWLSHGRWSDVPEFIDIARYYLQYLSNFMEPARTTHPFTLVRHHGIELRDDVTRVPELLGPLWPVVVLRCADIANDLPKGGSKALELAAWFIRYGASDAVRLPISIVHYEIMDDRYDRRYAFSSPGADNFRPRRRCGTRVLPMLKQIHICASRSKLWITDAFFSLPPVLTWLRDRCETNHHALEDKSMTFIPEVFQISPFGTSQNFSISPQEQIDLGQMLEPAIFNFLYENDILFEYPTSKVAMQMRKMIWSRTDQFSQAEKSDLRAFGGDEIFAE